MSNMSYCRFNNTLADVRDCIGALEDKEPISEFERLAAETMLMEFLEFCWNEGLIPDYNSEQISLYIEERLEK